MDVVTLNYKINTRSEGVNKEGKLPIVLVAYSNGKRQYLPTHKFVKPKDWNKTTQKVIGGVRGDKNSIALNMSLDAFKSKVRAYVDEFNRLDNGFNLKLLKKIDTGLQQRKCFIAYMQAEINRRFKNADIKENTRKTHQNTLNNLKKFVKTLPFNELNQRLMEDFDGFLINELKHNQNTRSKHHKEIRTYIRIAIFTDKIIKSDQDPYCNFRVGWQKSIIEYITPEELKIIEDYKPINATHELVKDAFLVSCYTGLAYAEYSRLSTDEIKQSDKDGMLIQMFRQKTGSEVLIPVSKLFYAYPLVSPR